MYIGLGLDVNKKHNRPEMGSISIFNEYVENFTLLDPYVEPFLEFSL
jgi:hypothetical protein